MIATLEEDQPRLGPSVASPPVSLDTVFREHFDALYRFFVRLGARPSDAEDLTQELFATVHARLHTFDTTRPIRPWLYGIAYNVYRDHRRRAHVRREQVRDDVEISSAERDSSPPQERALERTNAFATVRGTLAELDPELRVVLVLHELDELPMREVAEIIGIPLRTAYAHLEQARTAFAKSVRRQRGHGANR